MDTWQHFYRTCSVKTDFTQTSNSRIIQWRDLMALRSARPSRNSRRSSRGCSPDTCLTNSSTSWLHLILPHSTLTSWWPCWRVLTLSSGSAQSGFLMVISDSSMDRKTRARRLQCAPFPDQETHSFAATWSYLLESSLVLTIRFTWVFLYRRREWREKISSMILAGSLRLIHLGWW